MAINYAFIIKKLQSLNEIHVAYSAATNMPFVTCDEETFNDQIWIFTSPEDVQEFAKQYAEKKILFKGMRVPKESLGEFYMDVHSMGINEVVFCDGKVQHKLEFEKLVNLPDFSKLPERQRPLFNPSLQLSTVYFLQEVRRPGVEPDKEKLEAMAEEMYANIVKSKFLMPVRMEPATEGNESKLNMLYITDPKGNKFQPIFSDHTEYMKHMKKNKPTEHTRVLMVGVEELQKYLLPHVQAYILNPDGYCHTLSMNQLKFIREHFENKK